MHVFHGEIMPEFNSRRHTEDGRQVLPSSFFLGVAAYKGTSDKKKGKGGVGKGGRHSLRPFYVF